MALLDTLLNLVKPVQGIKAPSLVPPVPTSGHGPVMAYGNPPGMLAAGNIDLSKLNTVKMGQDWGTVRSADNDINGKEMVYPTIVNGVKLSDQDAYKNAVDTGRNLGTFAGGDWKNASDYAQKLHADWERPGILGLAQRDTPVIGAPYPSSQYAPLRK